MRKAVVLMRTELDDPRRFKEIYEYAFHFAREECQKSLRRCESESESGDVVVCLL